MPKSTLVTPLVCMAAGVMAVAGCSSSSTSGTSSAGSTAAASSATSSSVAAAPTSNASSSAASPTSAPASSGSATLGAVIRPLALKLGCTSPTVSKPQASAGAALGAVAGINCTAGSNQYVLLQLKPGGSPATAAKGLLTAAGTTSGSVYYVGGPQWMVVGGPASTNTPPTKRDAQAVQAKIGGTVGSVSA